MTLPVQLLALWLAATSPAVAPKENGDLFDAFASGWRAHWRDESYALKATRYNVVVDQGRPVLHAVSNGAHAGLARKISLPQPAVARLSWRWKVAAPLTSNHREREKAGDDFAARVCVVFETSLVPLRTRSINYVWTAHEPANATYASPYSRNVAMIVVRSGSSGAGNWQFEERDIVADYTAFFGRAPTEISAVAVLVDTDNTGLAAEAWFADLRLAAIAPEP